MSLTTETVLLAPSAGALLALAWALPLGRLRLCLVGLTARR